MVTGSNPATGSGRHRRRTSEKPDLRCRLCSLRPEASPLILEASPFPRAEQRWHVEGQARRLAPSWPQTGYPDKALLKGSVRSPVRTGVARWQKRKDRRAGCHSGVSLLWFWKRYLSLASSSQDVTRATSQGGSKKHPQEARKAEPDARNHAEVRGPGHVILNLGAGASGDMRGGDPSGWRNTPSLPRQPALPPTTSLILDTLNLPVS